MKTGEGNNLLSNCSMEMELAQMKYFIILVQERASENHGLTDSKNFKLEKDDGDVSYLFILRSDIGLSSLF